MNTRLNKYQSSAEYVSPGHPDRVCDIAASIIINDIQKKDGPNSHAAVEVFLTHDTIIYSGEVKTTLTIDDDYLRYVTDTAFDSIGYYQKLRKYWTKDEVVIAEDLTVINKIYLQSPDIALGTTDKDDNSGYNDQGIYFSSADNTTSELIGSPMYAAKIISDYFYYASTLSILKDGLEYGPNKSKLILGPDNKCVVTMEVEDDGFTPICITGIILAIAHSSGTSCELLREYAKEQVYKILKDKYIISDDCKWTINGTGRFVIHGCISDTSMTGRKISVNHPSAGPLWMNKMIGGGSLVKPWHASDLILNLAARFISSIIVSAGYSKYAVVGCSCGIGQKDLQSFFVQGDPIFESNYKLKNTIIRFFREIFSWRPFDVATNLGIFDDNFNFSDAVENNFFGDPQTQPWEDPERIHIWVTKLKLYIDEIQG